MDLRFGASGTDRALPSGVTNQHHERHLRLGIPAFGTDGARSGIGSYLRQWLQAFEPAHHGFDVDVLAPRSEMAELVPAAFSARQSSVSDRLSSPGANMLWHQFALPFIAGSRKWDVAFLPAANRRLPAWLPCPTVGTVHDLAMARVKAKYDTTHSLYFQTVLPALIRRLSRVVTVSECSKRDIVDLARVDPSRIDVIPHGVDLERFHPDDDEGSRLIRASLGLDQPYLLYVARIEHPGKNHVTLIEAFDRVKSRLGAPHKLVFAGADWNGAEHVHAAAARALHTRDIVLLGFTAQEALPALYRGADALVFPSLYEGFGMPLLEAMASGVAVACSDVASLPEVGGEAARYFDPGNVESIAAEIEWLIEHETERRALALSGLARARLFDWKTSVSKTVSVLRRAVEEAS